VLLSFRSASFLFPPKQDTNEGKKKWVGGEEDPTASPKRKRGKGKGQVKGANRKENK
jgi:hypothetical protein